MPSDVKRLIEGKVIDITITEKPPQIIAKIRTAEGAVVIIDYKVHHSYFGVMRRKLQRGNTVKTAHFDDKTENGFVGIPLVELLE